MYVFSDRDWVGVTHFAAALLLTAAAVALLFLSLGSGSPRPALAPAALPASATAPPPPSIRRESAGHGFTVAGASFRVVAHPRAAWARVGGAAPSPGERLVATAITIRNRSRRGFNPNLLSYLLKGPRGAVFAPRRSGVSGPAGLGRAAGLPPGAAAEERLLFAVPASLRHPVLALQPDPARALEVRVPLRGH